MKFSAAAALALVAAASAAPSFVKRDGALTDPKILNFALTLEYLENAFYSDALKKFGTKAFTDDGFPSWVRGRLQQVADHEASHVDFLEKALGDGNHVAACTYNFPYNTPHEFTALSALIEGVGVSAYLGAAGAISDKGYLTAAGSILTIESRHQAWINSVANKGTPWSGAYDAPLSINEVYSLAAGFITECPPSNAAFLPDLKKFPGLTVVSKNPAPGKTVKLTAVDASGNPVSINGFNVAFIGSAGTTFAPIQNDKVHIPSDLEGTNYAVVTTASDSSAVTDDTIVAGPAILSFGLASNARQIS